MHYSAIKTVLLFFASLLQHCSLDTDAILNIMRSARDHSIIVRSVTGDGTRRRVFAEQNTSDVHPRSTQNERTTVLVYGCSSSDADWQTCLLDCRTANALADDSPFCGGAHIGSGGIIVVSDQ